MNQSNRKNGKQSGPLGRLRVRVSFCFRDHEVPARLVSLSKYRMGLKPGIQKIGLLCVFLLLGFSAFSCKEKPEQNAERTNELENVLAENPENPEHVLELMNHYFFNTGNFARIIELYESNENLLASTVDAEIVYGAALCAHANDYKEEEQQAAWAVKGMIVLDDLVAEHPENPDVFIWRAMTYSNFPSILNARSIVQDDVDHCFQLIKDGQWILSEAQVSYLYQAMLNVGINYKDKPYLEAVLSQMQQDVPDSSPLFSEYENALSKL